MDQNDSPLNRLAAAFRERSLTKRDWTHEAHLGVGLWHLLVFGEAAALDELRVGIRALNEAHGTPNSETSGYHETITWAYLRLLQHVRQQHPGPLAADELAGLVNESLRDRTLLTRYYSTELLASPEARRRIMIPDRNPLPR